MAQRRVRIHRMRTPSGTRCYKILKNGQRRFTPCPRGTKGAAKHKTQKRRKSKKSKSRRRRKGCSCK